MKKNILISYPLEDKLLISILKFIIVLSTISIIGNIIIGFDFIVNYKWIGLILISIGALRYINKKEYVKYFKIFIFSLILFIFLPNGWITSGGWNNFTIAYIFLICIGICYLLEGKTRIFFLTAEILIFMILIYVEYRFPHLIIIHTKEKQFKDMMIQMPLTLSAAAYILITFSNGYRRERKKIKEYSKLLKEKNKILEEISRMDELTGVYNRRYIFEKLDELYKRTDKEDINAIIIMIDIDNFKFINDNFGHVSGDEAIKNISKSIVNIIGDKGIVGRYGGDEFIIILEDVSIEEGKEITNKINRIKDSLIFDKDVNITLSGGMTVFNNKEIDHALSTVDELLYKAKNRGKNTIVFETNK